MHKWALAAIDPAARHQSGLTDFTDFISPVFFSAPKIDRELIWINPTKAMNPL